MNGIDVSGWQPKNITEIVDYDFVIIKATEGIKFVSGACDAQYQIAKQKGKLLGVYHFASGDDPIAEANFFIDNIKGYIGEAILVLDWEANAISKGAEWVRAFVKHVKARTNVAPVIYGSASPLSTHGIPQVAKEEDCRLWVAAYPNSEPTGYRDEPQLLGSIIRQYASTGRLNGYNGNLDLNRTILTADQWKAYATGNRAEFEPETPTPIKKTNDEIANEVLAGKWGNGEERRTRLTVAGYDYSVIQSLVNQKLGIIEKKSNDQIAIEVMGGLWGNGDDRRNKLTSAGYNYDEIQNIVNQKMADDNKVYITIPSGPDGYLSNIAAKYGSTVQQIINWNLWKYPNMSANYVQAGWTIRVK